MGLSVTSTADGSAVVVRAVGELDLLTAPELLTVLDAHLADPAVTVVVLDLSRVEFLGAAGLGVLAEVATRAGRGPGTVPAHPAVRLVAPAEHRAVVRPWERMHLQQIVPLHPTVPDALAAP